MTVAFSSKMVKKIGNKKILTGRLFRQRIKKNKKLAKSGKYCVYVCVLHY